MNSNTTKEEAVHKMAGIMRNVAFLSLVTNVFEVYGVIRGEPNKALSMVLGISGTVLIWVLSKALQQGKKQALYYWLTAGLFGYIRGIIIASSFTLNVLSVIFIAIFIILTIKIFTWTKNGLLT